MVLVFWVEMVAGRPTVVGLVFWVDMVAGWPTVVVSVFWVEMVDGLPTVGVSVFWVEMVGGFASKKKFALLCASCVIFCFPKRPWCRER